MKTSVLNMCMQTARFRSQSKFKMIIKPIIMIYLIIVGMGLSAVPQVCNKYFEFKTLVGCQRTQTNHKLPHFILHETAVSTPLNSNYLQVQWLSTKLMCRLTYNPR